MFVLYVLNKHVSLAFLDLFALYDSILQLIHQLLLLNLFTEVHKLISIAVFPAQIFISLTSFLCQLNVARFFGVLGDHFRIEGLIIFTLECETRREMLTRVVERIVVSGTQQRLHLRRLH